jgi:hypothetical protein
LFKHSWEPGEATVVTSETANAFRPHSDWGTVSRRKYVVDVQPAAGGPLFRATIDQVYGEPEGAPGQKYRALGDGEVVQVLFDPKREKVKFDDSDPRLYKPRSDAPSAFDVAAGAAPGTPLAGAAPSLGVSGSEAVWQSEPVVRMSAERPPADAPDPLERLQKLADLHARGVLTDAEFAAQKAKILGES